MHPPWPPNSAQRGLNPLWVVLGLLGLLCSGGILVIATLAYKTQGAVHESIAYGDQSLLAIGKEWAPNELRDRMSPHLAKSTEELEVQTEEVCKKLDELLGPIMPTSPVSRILHVGAYSNPQIGPHKLVRYQAEAEFTKAWGVVTMVLIDQGGNWRIWSFYAKPGRVSTSN